VLSVGGNFNLNDMTKNQERLRQKMSKLLFIDGVAIYYDPLQESKYKYTIVDNDGKFIIEKINGFGDASFFLESIVIQENGLFLGEHQYGKYLFDKEGNKIREDDFERFKRILINRDKLPLIGDLYDAPKELMESRFRVCSICGGWYEKEGNGYIDFGVDYNGLIYTYEYHSRVGKDYGLEIEYVNDKYGNKMYLHDFWRCFLLAKNGKSYLKAVREYLLLLST
jgi:hypothetical protein